MKRVILLAVIQAVVLFFIIGALAYALVATSFTTIQQLSLRLLQVLQVLLRLMRRRLFLPKKIATAEKRKRLRIIIRESDDASSDFCLFVLI